MNEPATIQTRLSALKAKIVRDTPHLMTYGPANGRRLTLAGPDLPVRYVRLSNPGHPDVELSSVTLKTASQTLDLRSATIGARKVAGQFLKSAPAPVTEIAGADREQPELIIELPEAVVLRELEFVGVANPRAILRWNPIVALAGDDGAWSVLYENDLGVAQLCQTLDEFEHSESDLSQPVRRFIATTVKNIVLSDLQPLMHRPSEAGLPAPETEALKGAFDSIFLRERSLEWTNHGAQRTFRFWSPVEKRRYLTAANQMVERLLELSPDVCLGFGSVLSMVRDGDFIPHDDDLDILIAFPSESGSKFAEKLALVTAELQQHGYLCGGDRLPSHRNVAMPGYKSIDVFIGFVENEFVSWFPGPRGVIRYDEVFPAQRVTFFDETCLIPRKPEAYLAKTYGSDWRTPLPGWGHKWDIKAYADFV